MGGNDSFSDDEELERQLAALNMDKVGNKVKKLKDKAPKRPVNAYDDDDFNDDELLAELHELMGDDIQQPTVSHKSRRVEQDSKQERAAAISEKRISIELSEPEDEPGDDEEAELAAIMASETKARPAVPKPTTSKPVPRPRTPVQDPQPPPPPQRASAGSDVKTQSNPGAPSSSDPKAMAKATITRRMAVFTANGLAAHQDGNSGVAAECAETVQLFQQALEMCDTTDITMADLEGIPKTPPPYRRKTTGPTKPVPIPTGPLSLEEELRARLAKFKYLSEDFQSKGENVKMKMNQRLGNQINQALVRLQRGHPIEPDKLPAPPGFSPLKPMSEWPKTIPAPAAPSRQPSPAQVPPAQPPPTKAPRASPIPTRVEPSSSGVPRQVPTHPVPQEIPAEPTPPVQDSLEEQKKVLIEKQQKFKKAALMYKQNGDLNAASKCLKAARELEKDIKQMTARQQPSHSAIPPPVSALSVSPASLLIPDLKKQLEMAVKMKTKLIAAKSTTSVQMYERLIQKVRIDLQICARAAQTNDGPVSFKVTEMRLPILEANADLPPDVLELKMTKIEGLKLPEGWKESDASTFVTYDFPFPHDSHQKGKTGIVYGTNEPEFEEVFQLQINRKSKQLQRILSRYPLKMFVYQKGGFLRSDKLCGEADIILDALDENANFSDTRDLLIGRRKTGGKISFEVRIQKPLDEKKMLTLKSHTWTTLATQL